MYANFSHHSHPLGFATSIAELARGEQLHTQSLNHQPSLCDAPGTKVLALRNFSNQYFKQTLKLTVFQTKLFNT